LCIRCQVGSKVGILVCEEVVGSSVGEEDIHSKVKCTVGAEVFAPADASDVIV
jgi:molybdopterin-binding protein